MYVKKKGITLTIDVDYSYNPNPRDDEHLGTMACYHSRYRLGDLGLPKTYEGWKEWFDENKDNICCILPLYLLDHSGLAMATRSFNNNWDSRQVGWIYCTNEQVKDFGLDINDKEKVKEQLLKEVEDYHEYISGAVRYCYFCLRNEDDEIIDSMTGFRERKISDLIDDMSEYTDSDYKFVFNAMKEKYCESCL